MLGSWLGSLARLLRVCDAESWSVTGVQVAERITTSPPSIVLIAGVQDPVLASLLEGDRYGVVQVPTGMLALEWARDFQPDAIILDNELPDMTGVEACRLLYGDLRIGGKVPILILAADGMSAEQRLSALRAGARDVLPRSHDSEDLLRKLQTYVRTKRAADAALGEGAVYATAGMHTRPGLVRRARELGALMARKHGALACLVFAVEVDPADPKGRSLVAHTARVLLSTERVSDVIGALGPTEFAVLAPATDHTGAVKLAQRIAGALQSAVASEGLDAAASSLRVGYAAVANLRYSPIDPVDLLAHATAALRSGQPEPGTPWVRRFSDTNGGSREDRVTAPRQLAG